MRAPRALAVPALLLLLLLPALPAAPAAGGSGTVQAYSITVQGQAATGYLGVPASPAPGVLIVLCHGYGGSAAQYRGALQDAADRGYLAVAMDYRGAQGAWKVRAGWQDTLAATLDLRARFPSVQRTIILGQSMGGQVSGLAVAHAPRGTYQYWVEDSGVEDLAEEWALPWFKPVIEADAGGTPLSAPQAYLDLSPVAQADAIAAQGLKRVFINHAVGDPIVTSTQGQEMFAALQSRLVPASLYTMPAEGHVAFFGYATVLDKAANGNDWAVSLQGVAGGVYAAPFLVPVGSPYVPLPFVPPISPPALP